jgi:archaellum biogenesis ATPase FlaH
MSLKWAKFYYERGLIVLPLMSGDKRCVINDWPKLDRDTLFTMIDDECNLGLRLDNLVIEDFEIPELWPAIHPDVSPEELARHTWVSRTGGGGLHVFARGEAKPIRVEGWIELRSGPGQYVVAPPSIHPETLRPYMWLTDVDSVGIIEATPAAIDLLRRKIRMLGEAKKFIESLLGAWTEGDRHDLSLSIAGCLRKLGYSREEAEAVVGAIAGLAHDEELRDRLKAVETTFQKPLNDVLGFSGLRERLQRIMGPERAAEIMRLLPRREAYFEVKPLSQLVAEAKPIEWIADGLVPKYGLVILAGKSGVGKSFFSLHLAHAVASGENLLGIVPIQHRGRVLIIDNENYPGLYLQRIAALGLNPLDGIDVLSLSGFRLDSARCIEWLEKTLMEHKYVMVILDSWSDLTSRIDENKADEVGRVLSRLRKLSYENDCCFVLVHHLRKNLPFAVEAKDELRGSSALVNEADVVLLMQGFKNAKFLKTIKLRYGDEQAFEIKFNKDGERLAIVGKRVAEPEIEGEVVRAVSAIEEYLMVKGNPATRGELIRELPFSKATVNRAISLALALGRIAKVGRGLYRLPTRLEQYT